MNGLKNNRFKWFLKMKQGEILAQTAVIEAEGFKDKCGVIGVFNSKIAVRETFLGLHALQHRGQEAAGIVSSKSNVFRVRKHHGTVFSNFSETDISILSNNTEDEAFHAIGHVRYSTSGAKDDKGIQPFFKEHNGISVAVAHNGNLTNFEELSSKVKKAGVITETGIDTELIMHLIFLSTKNTMKERVLEALQQIKGAFSLVILTKDFLCVARDEFGIRPLSMGRGKNGELFFSSETCALDAMEATFERDIAHGEALFVSECGVESIFPFPKKQPQKFCIFEYVYFARPDSILEGRSVYEARKEIGRRLAHEAPIKADVVVAVPDSGIPAALGFSRETGIPFEFGIIRSHYIGRTFIDPSQKVRTNKVKMKHNPNRAVLEGKRVVLVDDSIVRGTTSKKIVALLFEFGAKEVHLRISSPPTKHPCFYGIDTPNEKELIANSKTVEEIREFIGATSLAYISLEGLYLSVSKTKDETFCDACFTNKYFV